MLYTATRFTEEYEGCVYHAMAYFCGPIVNLLVQNYSLWQAKNIQWKTTFEEIVKI